MRLRLGSCSVFMADEITNGAGAGARCSVHVLLPVAMLAIGLDVGVARTTYGVALPAFARDLQLSLTAAGLLGTLHLIGYLLDTLASPSLNAKVGALALWCTSSKSSGPFGLVSKRHSGRVEVIMLRTDSRASAGAASRV